MPPTRGTTPWWSFLALGLSTRPTRLATLRITKSRTNDKINTNKYALFMVANCVIK